MGLTPSWDVLRARAVQTCTGTRLERESADRERGHGPPHAHSSLRLFDAPDESAVRVTLYRDGSSWCP